METESRNGERAAKACLFVGRPCEFGAGYERARFSRRRLADVVVGGKGEEGSWNGDRTKVERRDPGSSKHPRGKKPVRSA